MKKTINLGIAVGLGFCGPSVFAADSAHFEEIIVTAQKRDQSLQDVPMVVTAINSEQLANRGINSIEDLGNQIPSLQVATSYLALQVNIRGVGLGLYSGAGEHSIAMHFDGAYMSSVTAQSLLQNDLESVEVLNGPQGTLWGRNATAGVINFVSPKPPSEFGGSVSALAGSFGRTKVAGNIGGPVSDNTRVRLSLISDQNDGHIENLTTGNDIGGSELSGGRLSVDSDISEDFSVSLRTYYVDKDTDGIVFQVDDPNGAVFQQALGNTFPFFPESGTPIAELDPRKTRLNYDPWITQTLMGGSLTAHYQLSESLQLKSVTSYVDYDYDSKFDSDGTAIEAITTIRPVTQETFTQEFNLSGESDRLNWLLGLYYMKDSPMQDLTTPLGLFGVVNHYVTDEEVNSYATFADATYSVTDALRVYGGLRYLEEKREQDRSVTFFGNACAGGSASHFEMDDEATTGRLGVQFDVANDVMVYLQYATGWKSGGFEFINCNPPPTGTFEPEEVASVEVGMKATLLDGRMRLNMAAFDYDFEALQLEKIIGGAVSDVQNVDTSIRGFEMDLLYAALDNWQITFSTTLLDTEYDDFFIEDQLRPALGEVNIAGTALNRTPDWKAVLGVEYDQPLAIGSLQYRAEIVGSADYRLRAFPGYPGNLDVQESYEMYNAYLTFITSDDRWKLNAFVKNLTDEDDIKGSAYDGAAHYVSYLMPRTWGAEITWNF